jgi:hypothetical protein
VPALPSGSAERKEAACWTGHPRSVTAAVVSVAFLFLNGREFTATPGELTVIFLALAAGELSEVETADWFRRHIVQA